VALSTLVGCSDQPAAKSEAAVQAQSAAQTSPAMGQPQTTAAAAAQDAAPQTVTGTVVETMDAANYTYVRVKLNTGDVWAATSQFKVAVGDRVVVPLEMPMSNFRSKTLNRDFPLIYFVGRIAREGESVQPVMMSAHGSAASAAPTTAAPSQAAPAQPVTGIAPAPGGMTIGDVWAKRKTLGGKMVTIRGKVVKFNGGILGVNWLHLQDGTGTDKDGTNDITVTSPEAAKVGDVVTVTGKVALEKDLGSGYSYPVILEGATIVLK
jgi:hypothetical protein